MALADLPVMRRLELAELVRRHRALFDVQPAVEWLEGGHVVIGYDVDIFGTHLGKRRGILPGCEHCEAVWQDLRAIARAVLPSDIDRTSTYLIRPFDRSLYTQGSSERDDVLLQVDIRHKREFFAPLDQCEHRCMTEISKDLEMLGAQHGTWSERIALEHIDRLAPPLSR